MSKNKRKSSGRKPSTRSANRKALARDLAAILANPETPSELYNAIADALTDIETAAANHHSATHIENALTAYAATQSNEAQTIH